MEQNTHSLQPKTEKIFMNEELTDMKVTALGALAQKELIKKYFGGIEKRVRAAGSCEKAADIVAEACQGFEADCVSEILRLFLRRYAANLFEEYCGDGNERQNQNWNYQQEMIQPTLADEKTRLAYD
jgi:hypothetical protein